MEGDSFLPSEIARLVLGYLKKNGCNQAYIAFLTECEHLQEYASLLKQGTVYPTIIHGKDLEQMLQEYGHISLGLSNKGCADALYKKLDGLLQKLSCLEAAQSQDGTLYKTRNESSGVVNRGQVRNEIKSSPDSASDIQLENGLSAGRQRRPVSRVLRTSSKNTTSELDSGISTDRKKIGHFGSSSLLISASEKSECFDGPFRVNENSELAQTSRCEFQGCSITPIVKRHRCQTYHTANSTASSELASPVPVRMAAPSLDAKDRGRTYEIAANCFNLPELIDSLRGSRTAGVEFGAKNNLEASSTGLSEREQQDNDSGVASNTNSERTGSQQTSNLSSILPDFDQLGSPTECVNTMRSSKSQGRKHNSSKMKVKETPNTLSTPKKHTPPMNPIRGCTESMDVDLKLASPRRKRQPPKRRSMSSEFHLIGPPRVVAMQSALKESCIANSNDSFKSQASQGFVPCIEELCQNSKFAEKLAESINKLGQSKLGSKTTDEDVGESSANKLDHEEHHDSGKTTSDIGSDEKKIEESGITSDLFDQLIGQEDTINNIIDMTTNDPEFDVLFNMFNVDKNEFIEKEYGVKICQPSSGVQNLTFSKMFQHPETNFSITQPDRHGMSNTGREDMSGVAPTSASHTPNQSHDVQSLDGDALGSNVPKPLTSDTVASVNTAVPSGSVPHAVPLEVSSPVVYPEHNMPLPLNAVCRASKSQDGCNKPGSSLIEVVFPNQDGKGSTVEVVEVITIAEQAAMPVSVTQPLQPLNTPAGEASQVTDSNEKRSESSEDVLKPNKAKSSEQDDGKSLDATPTNESSQKLTEAITELNLLLSRLSQALLLHRGAGENGGGLENLVKSPASPAAAQLSEPIAEDLKQLLHRFGRSSTTDSLPALTSLQSKALEQLLQLVLHPVAETSGMPLDSSSAKTCNDEQCSTSEPKAKRRKHAKEGHTTQNKPGDSSDLSKNDRSSDKGVVVTCLDEACSSKEAKEGKLAPRPKRKGTRSDHLAKKKQTFVEPWKIDHSQDKRKFLGVVWNRASVPTEKVFVTEESASLLLKNGAYEGEVQPDATSFQAKMTAKQDKKRQKMKTSSLPELSAKDIVDVVNSPGVASSVDAQCLSLVSLDADSSMVVGSSNSLDFSKQQQHEKNTKTTKVCQKKASRPLKPGSHVRTLDFKSRNDSDKYTVTDGMGPSEDGENIQEENASAFLKPSMPSSFDFIFQKIGSPKDMRKMTSQGDISQPTLTIEPKMEQEVGKKEAEVSRVLNNLPGVRVDVGEDEQPRESSNKGEIADGGVEAERKEDDSYQHETQKLLTSDICENDNKDKDEDIFMKDVGRQMKSGLEHPLGQNGTSEESGVIKEESTDSGDQSEKVLTKPVHTVMSDTDFVSTQGLLSQRVASKPRSIEKKRLLQSDQMDDAVEQPVKPTDGDKMELSGNEKDSTSSERGQRSKGVLEILPEPEHSMASSFINSNTTPVKHVQKNTICTMLCSPKRTHILTKLLEQGMKMKSPKVKTACKRLRDNGLTRKQSEVKKLKKPSVTSLVAKISLSDQDLEKILSRIHK